MPDHNKNQKEQSFNILPHPAVSILFAASERADSLTQVTEDE